MPNATLTVSENAVQKILKQIINSRPSLFNYGTEFVRDHPDRLKVPIVGQAPIMTVPSASPKAPGTDTDADYLLQIFDTSLDFYPQSLVPDPLPPNIASTFRVNTILMKGALWLGLEIRPRQMRYLSFSVFFVVAAHISPTDRELVLDIARNGADEGFEIVDVSPAGLEDILEMISITAIRESLLQHVRASFKNIGFTIGSNPTLGRVVLVPGGAPNPAISGDALTLSFDVAIED